MNSPLAPQPVEAGWGQSPPPPCQSVEPDKTLEALLNGFLGAIVRTTGAKAGVIRLFSSCSQSLILAASHGLPNTLRESEACRPLNCGICGSSLRHDRIETDNTQFCARQQAVDFFQSQCQHVTAVPLKHYGAYLGVFTLFWQVPPSSDQHALLHSTAEMMALALDNGRLSQDNQRMKLMAERQAMANEIHDSLSQSLFFGRLRISVLANAIQAQDQSLIQQCLEDVGEALDSGQKSVRELIAHFRHSLDPLGLHHALKMLIDELKARSSIIFDYQHTQLQYNLTLEQEMQIFYILRESLNNLVIHSQASRARLSLMEDSTGLHFEVTDNGVGLGSPESPLDHYGLTIMKERARRIGAQLFFHSAPGVGTQIHLFLPQTTHPLGSL